jgi:hypothetical protein
VLVLGAAVLAPAPAAAQQELYLFSASALGGIGGSLDAEPGDSLSNTGYQIGFAMLTEPKTHVGVRVGEMSLDADERFGDLFGAELLYANVAGEYRYSHSYYDSGVYFGLGGYRLQGDDVFSLGDEDETALGGVLGVTGEFAITRRFGVLVELSGHWVDFDDQQVFVMGHAGFVAHF